MKKNLYFIMKQVFILVFMFTALFELYACKTINSEDGFEITSELSAIENAVSTVQDNKPENDRDENIAFFYQKDSHWKNDNLGTSKYKMSDSGCLTCCIASVFVMKEYSADNLAENYNAGDVNKYFSENNVYDAEGNIQWNELENLTGLTVEKTEESDITDDTLDKYLKSGYYPIVKVRVNGDGNYHFVLVVGKSDGEYQCMDPLKDDDKTVPISAYKNRIYAVRCLVGNF